MEVPVVQKSEFVIPATVYFFMLPSVSELIWIMQSTVTQDV